MFLNTDQQFSGVQEQTQLCSSTPLQPTLKIEPVDTVGVVDNRLIDNRVVDNRLIDNRIVDNITTLESSHHSHLAYMNPVQHAWNLSTDQTYFNTHSQVRAKSSCVSKTVMFRKPLEIMEYHLQNSSMFCHM